jgi:hypothetical protein
MTESPLIHLDHTADASSSSAVRVGIYTGALLVIGMLGALVATNRVAALERYALERNTISYSLFLLFMLIPVVWFWNSPIMMFGSAMIGWTMFASPTTSPAWPFRTCLIRCGTPLCWRSVRAVWYMGFVPSFCGLAE